MTALALQDATRTPVVSIIGGEAMANSLDVAAYFQKQHKDVLRAVRNANCSADFRERNFAPTERLDRVGTLDRLVPVVDMTRNGFAFVAMGFTGAKAGAFKEAYILQFDAMEAELRKRAVPAPVAVPQTLPEALRLAANLAEENERQRALIEVVRPKAQALDRIATSGAGSVCVTEAAKVLQMRPKDLFDWMRSNRWLYRKHKSSRDRAFEDKRQSGYLEHKVTVDGWMQVLVTPKGITRLSQMLTGMEPLRLV